MKAFRKLSVWKGIADLFLFLSVFGILTGTLSEEFYPLASWVIFAGAIVTLIFLVKQFSK